MFSGCRLGARHYGENSQLLSDWLRVESSAVTRSKLKSFELSAQSSAINWSIARRIARTAHSIETHRQRFAALPLCRLSCECSFRLTRQTTVSFRFLARLHHDDRPWYTSAAKKGSVSAFMCIPPHQMCSCTLGMLPWRGIVTQLIAIQQYFNMIIFINRLVKM